MTFTAPATRSSRMSSFVRFPIARNMSLMLLPSLTFKTHFSWNNKLIDAGMEYSSTYKNHSNKEAKSDVLCGRENTCYIVRYIEYAEAQDVWSRLKENKQMNL